MCGGRRALDSAAAPAAVVAIREIDGRWRYGAGERSVWGVRFGSIPEYTGKVVLSFYHISYNFRNRGVLGFPGLLLLVLILLLHA